MGIKIRKQWPISKYECSTIKNTAQKLLSGTQRIISVTYLFGRSFIPYNFLKGIFTSNFRDMGNLRPGVTGLTENVVSGAKKKVC